MQRIRTILAVALGLLGLASVSARVKAQGGGPVPYVLENGSEFERGCFGPCACPVLPLPMAGRFALTRVSDNGLFTTYAVTRVDWNVSTGAQDVRLTGSGTYRIGGEVAIEHQLILDLSLDGRPPRHFDSGLVPGGSEFPKIYIQAPAHGFACYDTVLVVRAAPATPTAVGPEEASVRLSGIEPNPFRLSARVDFTLPSPGRVDLAVYDVRGRLVRTLARGRPFAAGRYSLPWNGLGDDSARAPSGAYFVRLAVDGRLYPRQVVKLR